MRVWLVSGGSLGHVLPAISFFYGLKEKGVKPQLALEDRPVFRRVVDKLELRDGVKFFPIVPSPRKAPIDSLGATLRLTKHEVRDVLERGDKVVFFGSGLSFPFYLIGLRKGLSFFVHEQNVVMGNWTGFLSVSAGRVFAGFDCSGFPFYARKKCRVSGNLVVDFLSRFEPEIEFSSNRFKILVLGGTKGARSLNYALPEVLSSMKEELEVVHLCGEDQASELIARYRLAGFDKVRVVSWVFPVLPVMRQADLVISRAGAMTLTELALAGTPALLVPYPYARGHQCENARFFSDNAGVPWVDQRRAGWQDRLASIILTLVGDSVRRREMAHALRGLTRWGGQDCLDLLLS